MSASKVRRGGSWLINPENLRSADRSWDNAGYRHDGIGFRVLHTTSDEEHKSIRGGSWFVVQVYAGSAFRVRLNPVNRLFNVGFRVLLP